MGKSILELLTGASEDNNTGSEKTSEYPEQEYPAQDLSSDQPSSSPPEEEKKDWLEEPDEGQLTLDVYQDGERIVIKSTIAGVKPEDLDVSINNDMVTIRGERKRDEEVLETNYYYQELYWGAFSRSVILPAEVDPDRAQAELRNGILTIRLPKKDSNHKRSIEIDHTE